MDLTEHPTYTTERKILERVVTDLLAREFSVYLLDGEGDERVLSAADAVEAATWYDTENGRQLWNLDEFWIRASNADVGLRGLVYFVVSNGAGGREVICDYSLTLEDIIDPIITELCE